MGLSGLLPLLSADTRRAHAREYSGRRVAIDASCWLYKAAYSCALELFEGKGMRFWHEQRGAYCMKRVALLRYFGGARRRAPAPGAGRNLCDRAGAALTR